ncbi:uncharacterized protein EV154DRAFT_512713 [Mucor mucedo]|uniref:Fe2OG dioxygenase domain-containing protein n=1 Tax=Mucor saturninus TaxID=64648 RepID=A0A8H7RDW6_9FUNG|nr:uncharacterized protein EV154DRAFT_512713 [Mucor mucedo]KAG2208705.1 hypothetical protein INT47_007804 [Mucor saturninus]KAI7890034.1 hypothetical protein EV154DRAFT_512713 [Mucor mucedo]
MPKKQVKKGEQSASLAPFPKLEQKQYLEMTELEAQQIYVIPNFLHGKECDALVQYFEKNLPPKENVDKPKRGYAFRNNDRQALEDADLAQEIWKGMETVVQASAMGNIKVPKGLNSNIRVYRYRKGHSFGAHYDESVQDKATGLWTDWTLLIYLNQDMVGGETVFYKDSSSKNRKPAPIVVQPEKGMALLHRHGQHCLLHEAMEVTEGSKWVLRSDVLV